MMSGIFIEKNDEGNFYVSFPPDSEYRSENDDLEFDSVDDALEFLDENCFVWGRLELQYVKRVCSGCRDKGYLVRRDDSTIYVERCDVCEMYDSDRDAARHVLHEAEKGI